MSKEKLTAYATIGAEHQRIMQERLDKVKKFMGTLSDDEYEQLLKMADTLGDAQMKRDLPIWRALAVKKNGDGGRTKGSE